MTENTELTKRHEKHFEKIFQHLDDFRNNYVRSPTFVISLVTIVLIMASSAGWLASKMFSDIDKNEQDIFKIAKEQVRIEERQNNFEETQEQVITQLIETLKKTTAK